MRKTKLLNIGKILLHGAALLIVYVLQAAMFPRLAILGVKPLLLPVIVVCIAMHEGPVRGALVGLAAGILCDVSLNEPAVLFTLLLTGVGLGAGYLAETFLVRGFLSCLLTVLAALLLCTAVQMLQIMVAGGIHISRVWAPGLVQVLYSLLFVIPMYLLSKLINLIAGTQPE